MTIFRMQSVLMLAMPLLATPMGVQAETHALLIGVSAYPAQTGVKPLKGPANDVSLLAEKLRELGVKSVRVLSSQAAQEQDKPLHDNILKALKDSTAKSDKGDWLILYFSGHGTQVPQLRLDVAYREPDQLDEVFLPQDIGRWDSQTKRVRNALIDDEIAEIINPALSKGVSIWAIFDTCHAGDMTKTLPNASSGSRQSVWRSVNPTQLGVPGWSNGKPTINQALKGAQVQIKSPKAGKLIAYFAAQSDEPAPEEPLLPQQNMGGVFTWHLLQALNQPRSQGANFGSLIDQIRQRYRQEQRPFPTPYMEGQPNIGLPF